MVKTYNDVMSHSRAGDILTGSVRPSQAPLALLPKTSWWKLFIDRKYHRQASPALLFDQDKSPGFHAVMMKAFKTQLGVERILLERLKYNLFVRLNYKEYLRLYQAVSNDVGGIAHRGPSGTDCKVGSTSFPPIYIPTPACITELAAEGVGYRNFPAQITLARDDDKVVLMVYGFPPEWRFHIKYRMAEGPLLADRFFDRYYTEIGCADGHAYRQVMAIVRLVRVLHVYHFFRDANGRLNTMLLLNQLLLENGFPPAIVSDPAIFGGGRTLHQLVVDVNNGMKSVLQEMEAHQRFRHLDLAL